LVSSSEENNQHKDKAKKRSLLLIKGREIVSAADYRALLAFILVIGYLYVVLFGSCEAIASIGPLAGAAVAYYFHGKRSSGDS
jgi:uncharacterized membrane protein